MDDEPPKLTIAASNDDASLAKQRALDDLRWPTREMAANLFRVTRGAGKPWELPQQIIDLSGLILEASKLSNAWGIWTVIEEELQSGMPHGHDGLVGSEETIVRGSLQLLASKLLHQNAQMAAGGREIDQGIRMTEQERERSRAQYRAEAAAALAAVKAVRRELKGDPSKPKPKKRSTAEAMRKRARELERGPQNNEH